MTVIRSRFSGIVAGAIVGFAGIPTFLQPSIPSQPETTRSVELIPALVLEPPAPQISLPTRAQIEKSTDPFSLIRVDQFQAWQQDPRAEFLDKDDNCIHPLFMTSQDVEGMQGLELRIQLPNPELPETKGKPGSTYFDIGYRFIFTPNQNDKPGNLCILWRMSDAPMETSITDPASQLKVTQQILSEMGQFAQIMRGEPDPNAPLQPGEAFLRIFQQAAKIRAQGGKAQAVNPDKPQISDAPKLPPAQEMRLLEKNRKNHIY